MEQSGAGDEVDFTNTWTVLNPAENENVSSQLLHIGAAIIILLIRLA